jgi:serine/threonine protein kinase
VIRLLRGDDLLEPMRGSEIPSDVSDGVTYRLDRALGFGGLFVSFLAARRTGGGEVTVVVKMLRPSVVRKLGEEANLVVRKEAVALGRLNERVPPTPFVVRLVDAGAVRVEQEGRTLELPWVAVEHVAGGADGSTLAHRVRRSIERRGHAFSAMRAAHAIECIAQGLSAAHAVGVIHRDLAPQAVLCSGSGPFELFKISDFGAARAEGLRATLAAWSIGTPGYVAPEHAGLAPGPVGPWTDVYGFAAVIYYVLTGERLHTESGARPGLLEGSSLAPELRAHATACRAIDEVLAWASAPNPELRLAEPLTLSAVIGPHLRSCADRMRTSIAPGSSPGASRSFSSEPPEHLPPSEGWSWSWLHQPPNDGFAIRSVAWDGYGRALAATSRGLWLWDGTLWRDAAAPGFGPETEVDFISRGGPGRWILGCADQTLAVCTVGGVTQRIRGPSPRSRYRAWSGVLDDVGVLVASAPGAPQTLHAKVGNRWLKPLALPEVSVRGTCRVDDEHWLVIGRIGSRGYAAIFAPLAWELERVSTSTQCAFVACDGLPSRGLGLTTALEGGLLWRESNSTSHEDVGGNFDVSAAAIDPNGLGWAAGAGRIWMRESGVWRLLWSDPRRELPIVSLYCDVDRVDAIFADGGMVAGRRELTPTRQG